MGNNIFTYAPKELTTDAFLKWLFIELDVNEALKEFQSDVFAGLGLCARGDSISAIRVDLQVEQIDLLLRYKVNAVDRKILFENKTWTTFHSNQLQRYPATKNGKGADDHIYLKLSYVHSEERKHVVEAGFRVVGSGDLRQALDPIADRHLLIGQYCEYLDTEFILPRAAIEKALEEGVDNDIFRMGGAQKIFLDQIRERLGDSVSTWMKVGTNRGGSPWSELEFCKAENLYGDSNETVFLRLDKRAGKYYARLNQYADTDAKYLSPKKWRLKKLREFASPFAVELGLTEGKLSNSGRIESEIAIFFVEENGLHKLREKLPLLMERFAERYREFDRRLEE